MTEKRRIHFDPRPAVDSIAARTGPIEVIDVRRPLPLWAHALILAPVAVPLGMLAGYLAQGAP